MRSLWLTFALALAASAGPAMAAPLTVNYAYSVGPFLPGIAGTGVPIDPWTGTLDVTFDPAVAGAGTSAAMQSNAALPGPWDYVSWFADGHLNLEIGNDCSLGIGPASTRLPTASCRTPRSSFSTSVPPPRPPFRALP